jgi:hypothetical protein
VREIDDPIIRRARANHYLFDRIIGEWPGYDDYVCMVDQREAELLGLTE